MTNPKAHTQVFRHVRKKEASHRGFLGAFCATAMILATVVILLSVSSPTASAATTYGSATNYTVPNDVKDITPTQSTGTLISVPLLMDLDAEEIKNLTPDTFYYLMAGGKWNKIKSSATGTIPIDKYLKTAQSFQIRTADAEGEMEDANAAAFPQTAAKPTQLAKATLNYLVFQDKSAKTAGGWTLTEKGVSVALNDSTYDLKLIVTEATNLDGKNLKQPKLKSGTWKEFPDDGILVAAPKTPAVSYVVRVAAEKKADGTYVPASDAKSYKPASQTVPKALKVDYKKEIIKVPKGYSVIAGETLDDQQSNLITTTASYSLPMTSVLDAYSNAEEKNTVSGAVAYWVSATEKKPASAVAYYGTSAAVALLFDENATTPPPDSSAVTLLTRGSAVSFADFSATVKGTTTKWKVTKGLQVKNDSGNWVNCKAPTNNSYVRKGPTKENAAGITSYILLDAASNEISSFPYTEGGVFMKITEVNSDKNLTVVETPLDPNNTIDILVTYMGISEDDLNAMNFSDLQPPVVSFVNAIENSEDCLPLKVEAANITEVEPYQFKFSIPALIPQSSNKPVSMEISMGSWTYTGVVSGEVYQPAAASQSFPLKVPQLEIDTGNMILGKDVKGADVTSGSSMTLFTGIDYGINLVGETHTYYEGNVLTIPIDGLAPDVAGEDVLAVAPSDDRISLEISPLNPTSPDKRYEVSVEGESFKIKFLNDKVRKKTKYTFKLVVGKNLTPIYKSLVKKFDVTVEVVGTDSYLAYTGDYINTTAFKLSDNPTDSIIESNSDKNTVGAKITVASQYFDITPSEDAAGKQYTRYTEHDGAVITDLKVAHTGEIVVKGDDTTANYTINSRYAKPLVDVTDLSKQVYYMIADEPLILRDLPETIAGFAASAQTKQKGNWSKLTQYKGMFGLSGLFVEYQTLNYGQIVYIAVVSKDGEEATVYSFNVVSEQTAVKPNVGVDPSNFASKSGDPVEYGMTLGAGIETDDPAIDLPKATTPYGYLPIAPDAGGATVANFTLNFTTYDPGAEVYVSSGTTFGAGTEATPDLLKPEVKTFEFTGPINVDSTGLATNFNYIYIKIVSSDGVATKYYKMAVVDNKFTLKTLEVVDGSTGMAPTTGADPQTDNVAAFALNPGLSGFGKIELTKGSYKDSPLKLNLEGVFQGKSKAVTGSTDDIPVTYLVIDKADLPAARTTPGSYPFIPYNEYSGIAVDTDSLLYVCVSGTFYAYEFESEDTSIGNGTPGNRSMLSTFPVIVASSEYTQNGTFGSGGQPAIANAGVINIGNLTSVSDVAFTAKTTDPGAKVEYVVIESSATTYPASTAFARSADKVTIKSGQYLCIKVTPSADVNAGPAVDTNAEYYMFHIVSDAATINFAKSTVPNTDVTEGTIVNTGTPSVETATAAYRAYQTALREQEEAVINLTKLKETLKNLDTAYKTAEKELNTAKKELTAATNELTTRTTTLAAFTSKEASLASLTDDQKEEYYSNKYQIEWAKAITAHAEATQNQTAAEETVNALVKQLDFYAKAIYGSGASYNLANSPPLSQGSTTDGVEDLVATATTTKSDADTAVGNAKTAYEAALDDSGARETLSGAAQNTLKGTLQIHDGHGADITLADINLIATDEAVTVTEKLAVSNTKVYAGDTLYAEVTSTSGLTYYYAFDVYTFDGSLDYTAAANTFAGADISPVMTSKDLLPTTLGTIKITPNSSGTQTATLTLTPKTVYSSIYYLVTDTPYADITTLNTAFGVGSATPKGKPVNMKNGTAKLDATVTLELGKYLYIQSRGPLENSALTTGYYYYGFSIVSENITLKQNTTGNIVNYVGANTNPIVSFGDSAANITGAKAIAADKAGRIVIDPANLKLTGVKVYIAALDPKASISYSLDGVDWRLPGATGAAVDLDVEINRIVYVAIAPSAGSATATYYKLLVGTENTDLFINATSGGSKLGEASLADAGTTPKSYTATFDTVGAEGLEIGEKELNLVFGSATIKDKTASYEIKSVKPAKYAKRPTSSESVKPASGYEIDNLWVGDEIVVTVTASDGVTKKDYTIKVAATANAQNTSADRAALDPDPTKHTLVGGTAKVISVAEGDTSGLASAGIGIILIDPATLTFDSADKLATLDAQAAVRYCADADATTPVWKAKMLDLGKIDLSKTMGVEVTSSNDTSGTGTTVTYYKFTIATNKTALAVKNTSTMPKTGASTGKGDNDTVPVFFTGSDDVTYAVTLIAAQSDANKIGDAEFQLNSVDGSKQTYAVKQFIPKPHGNRDKTIAQDGAISNGLLKLEDVWHGDKIIVTVTASDTQTKTDITITVSAEENSLKTVASATLDPNLTAQKTALAASGSEVLIIGTPDATNGDSAVEGKFVYGGQFQTADKLLPLNYVDASESNAIVRYALSDTFANIATNGDWKNSLSELGASGALAATDFANFIYVEVTSAGATDSSAYTTTINYYKFQIASNVTALDETNNITLNSQNYESQQADSGNGSVSGTVTITLESSDGSIQTYEVKKVTPKAYGGRAATTTATIATTATGGTLNLDNVYIGDKITITVTASDGKTKADVTILITAV